MKFELLDRHGDRIADGYAELNGNNMWCGEIIENAIQPELISLFADQEEQINNQEFGIVQRTDDLIAGHSMHIRLEDGRLMRAKNLLLTSDLAIAWSNNTEQ